jgi:ribosomal protein L20A (L18A)
VQEVCVAEINNVRCPENIATAKSFRCKKFHLRQLVSPRPWLHYPAIQTPLLSNMSKMVATMEETPRSMREIVQKKFLDEVIGIAGTVGTISLPYSLLIIYCCAVIAGWKVLVMDGESTRVISSALTMYDIMERRVTLVEQLEKNRQPFADMDVIYLATPTVDAARKICGDFESRQKAKYGSVHIFFIDTVGSHTTFATPASVY